ncbi:hypothetical protein OUZ56_012288 [Daphnia magna]|uniref:Uncharacterized protein n=1 Tax=Daphnia magna TaxID=35525 RepID=A0ABQ9Z2K4_9CRUS|nr:hypothetical protein OUZ56_012288 [Daphnia magna]
MKFSLILLSRPPLSRAGILTWSNVVVDPESVIGSRSESHIGPGSPMFYEKSNFNVGTADMTRADVRFGFVANNGATQH